MKLLEIKNLSRNFNMGASCVKAVDGVSFEIDSGELVVIVGPSGSGKTTLLNLLGGIDNPTSGNILLNDNDISKLKGYKLLHYRKNNIGFIFQFYNLIQNLTVLENVDLIAKQCKKSKRDSLRAIEQVGLLDKINHFPAQLSGGEQQRVATARAIVKNPPLLLCDEPTGALDLATGKQILQILQKLASQGTTVIIITHNNEILKIANKQVRMRAGKIDSISINNNPSPASTIEW